jgi:hypothetical protein
MIVQDSHTRFAREVSVLVIVNVRLHKVLMVNRHQQIMRRNITMRFRRLGSSALVTLVGITLGIGLQGSAAQDRLLQAVSHAKCRTTLVRLTIRLRPLLKIRSRRRSVAIGFFSRLGLARSIQTWGSICLLRPSQARQARPTPIFCASASRRPCG